MIDKEKLAEQKKDELRKFYLSSSITAHTFLDGLIAEDDSLLMKLAQVKQQYYHQLTMIGPFGHEDAIKITSQFKLSDIFFIE